MGKGEIGILAIHRWGEAGELAVLIDETSNSFQCLFYFL